MKSSSKSSQPTDVSSQNVAKTTPKASAQNQSKESFFKKKIVKIIGIIILAIILFIVVISTVVNQTTKDAVKTSDQFIAAMQTNDAAKAYAVSDATFKSSTSQDILKTTFERISPILNGKPSISSKAIGKTSGSDATARIVYKIKGSDGKTWYVKVGVVKVGDQWLVNGMISDDKPLDATEN